MSAIQRVGFLDLPAEIRNEIYSHLIEDIDTNVGARTIRLRPRTDFPKHWSRKNPYRGDVYSLNQVCRTTRHEFGPLYVAHIAHRIRVDERLLPQFVQDFLLVGGNFALRPKKIEIELAYPLGGNPPKIDVLPLLTMCLGNEELQCTFLNKFGSMSEVDELFFNHTVAWGDAILDDLSEILLYTPHGTITIVELIFRGDCRRSFMEELPIGKPKRTPSSMDDYLTNLGAVGIRTWNARVGVWNTEARVDFVARKRALNDMENYSKTRKKVFGMLYQPIET